MLYDPQSWSLPPSAQRVTNAGANRGHCHGACKGLRMLCNPSRVHYLWVRRGWPVLRDLYSVLFSLDRHRNASAVQPSNVVIATEHAGGCKCLATFNPCHFRRVCRNAQSHYFWSLLNAVRPYIQVTTTTTDSHVLECCAGILPFGFVTILCTRLQMLRRPNKQHLRENPL